MGAIVVGYLDIQNPGSEIDDVTEDKSQGGHAAVVTLISPQNVFDGVYDKILNIGCRRGFL
jgi:hypothetical protein